MSVTNSLSVFLVYNVCVPVFGRCYKGICFALLTDFKMFARNQPLTFCAGFQSQNCFRNLGTFFGDSI